MATQKMRCIYCDFTTPCLNKETGAKGIDEMGKHIKLKHQWEVTPGSILKDIELLRDSIRNTKLPCGTKLEVIETERD